MFAAAVAANSAAFNICGYQRTRRSISMRRVTATRRSLAVNNNNNNHNNIESVSHQSEQQQDEEEDPVENSLGVEAAISMLRFYKTGEISPLLPNSCRYVPTCSEYSMEAYKKYGVVKGTVLTAWRLCRCNPLGGSGFDPPRWFDEDPPIQEE
uniref:Membrane protein insertion efficiency factor n=1 Tax=Salix viminalis TaxID=40686 RepID=A0A6N2M4L3_SALVM